MFWYVRVYLLLCPLSADAADFCSYDPCLPHFPLQYVQAAPKEEAEGDAMKD